MELKIKRGLDLRLEGAADPAAATQNVAVTTVAVSPDDFAGFVPKTCVHAGDKVRIGDPLMYNKTDEAVKLVSPVTGTVTAVERGARRHIDRIVIAPDGQQEFVDFDVNPKADALSLIGQLAQSGLLALIRRRPYADVPLSTVRPRDIFVSSFDSAPLAVDRRLTDDDRAALQAGADALAAITTGKVYISVRPDTTLPTLKGVETVTVTGPHPAGLPGVLAANIAPVNKGETIWTLTADTLWRIGRLMTTRHFDPATTVAVCGSCVQHPLVADTIIGADVDGLLKTAGLCDDRHIRVIAGNVLTGVKVDAQNDFLHYPYTQLTVIPEGDDVDEFMGWASLSTSKMSVSPSYPGHFLRRLFNPDARINGGRRAMIMSGEYDRVLPMDIMAEYLIKAIVGRDIDSMEKLGIYEVAPEDFALAECLDTSKLPLQSIVRQGLDYLRKELEQ